MLQRREFLAGALLALPLFRLARAAERRCSPTDGVELGPFYRPNAPRRISIAEAGDDGEPLAVEGRVIGADACAPLAGAVIEVWHADADGDYDIERRGQDDTPLHLRSLLTAGSAGAYAFDTVMPGHYGRRAKHIHYFAHANGYEPLVTQLYFAGDDRNDKDRLVRKSLIMKRAPARVRGKSGARTTFDLALRRRVPNPPEAVKQFPALEGEYRSDGQATFRLVRAGDRLDVRIAGMPDAELIFDSASDFRVLEYGLRGRVLRQAGRPPALETVDIGGRRERAEKL